jgi:hypothetical protein
VQGFLELAGIPYVGSGVASSAVAMDKDIMKRLFRSAGLLTPNWLLVRRLRWEREREGVLVEAEKLGYPCFVKPANLGAASGSRGEERRIARAIDEAVSLPRRSCRRSRRGSGRFGTSQGVVPEVSPRFTTAAPEFIGSDSCHHPPSCKAGCATHDAIGINCSGMARVDFSRPGRTASFSASEHDPGLLDQQPAALEASGSRVGSSIA